MRICIAQLKSLKGEIRKNIETHLQIIQRAIELKADLIIFPELSITGYEPTLAKALATNVNSSVFNPFQELSNKNDLTIGIGMPTNASDGINISLLLFQPNTARTVYSKQLLHSDELLYFVGGKHPICLHLKQKKIAFGICYETLQRAHIAQAKQDGADLYIASVAKSKQGIEKAYLHFPKIAQEFQLPILMSNSIGFCDNFLSAGQSAVWNEQGILVQQLDSQNQGILMYDTDLDTVESDVLKIEKGQLSDLNELFPIYQQGKIALEEQGIFQWTNNYPTRSIIERDLEKGVLYLLKNNSDIIGAITINEEQDEAYQTIDWKFKDSKVLVIHRLVVHPKQQRKGYAKKMMDFAEDFARDQAYSSIRLDAYSKNKRAVNFYKNRTYIISGKVYFPERKYFFHCMEKEIHSANN